MQQFKLFLCFGTSILFQFHFVPVVSGIEKCNKDAILWRACIKIQLPCGIQGCNWNPMDFVNVLLREDDGQSGSRLLLTVPGLRQQGETTVRGYKLNIIVHPWPCRFPVHKTPLTCLQMIELSVDSVIDCIMTILMHYTFSQLSFFSSLIYFSM